MDKRLLISALAVLPLQSYAQSSVTLFGLLDEGVTYVSNAGGHSLVQMASGIQAPNLLGLRGTEDLGGGYQAFFVLDSQPDINTGKQNGGAFTGRESYVGLASPFGTLTLGRQFDYMFDNLSIARWGHQIPFVSLYQLPGGPFAKLGAPLGTFDYTRIAGGEATPNAIKFTSKTYAGIDFGAMYGFSNLAGQTGSNNLMSFGANYNNGPLRLNAAYTYSKEDGIDDGHSGIRNFGFGGRYDFGMVALDVLYTNTKNTLTNGHVDSYEAGGLITFAPDLFLYANYIYAKGNEQVDNSHSNQAGLTLDYLLSKRTDVYVNAIFQRASGGGAVASVNGTFATSSSQNQTVLRLGMRTLF
ncbi:porin [Caballeronia sp. ATUFL_M2_KS44]|uniref:porin n=1 Tax=Caballeronia sp. ATUFL_M2_KS44 TaxID=2921767 RepID=UPI0020298FC2|nr:porin [Caballeronia sp. ATUFL_M2_KS44]